ncbi:NAD-dependent succinate-semialdehyde dehydrogenase [Halobaculum magnesiiphilum]|uniref:NAD-dependent succinate-semialdehyde dehydrogenase n=1 Tax=Halobaculum magnesiiphilum TaxID=1017351 RepID=A0A8T8WEV8_9EURY|nr:NAD-dependent succinate-semialdehyde dehydrogenase [Halobaculum magnesiiphilum]QZP38326.1 NAD-dependent succinate-semialdehyde dehydrogenase [Halobaculum magnesiiphilum]
MESVNPETGDVIATYDGHDGAAVESALSDAAERFESWAARPIQERCRLLERTADLLRERTDEYAELMTREMGKPVDQARAEVEKCAWVCDYYAERAPEQLADETIGTEADARTLVSYEPLGPVLAVMPWNFPLWQVFRFAAPNLAAGNVGLLKHASNVPGCALAIEEVLHDAGVPEGAFTTLLIGSDRVDDVIADDRVRAVTLTGSEPAGRAVAETAGRELKKTVLELGGSDPFVVLDDAPIAETAEKAAYARTQNNGQSCIAAKRFIVHTDAYDEFVGAFAAELDALTVGDPTDEDTDVGPQAREDLMRELHDQVERTVEAGATLSVGGEPLDRDGPYYPPTLLTDVPVDSPAATEETFGPVAAVFEVADEAEALALANDTSFGLGASVWTDDPDRGERFVRRFDAGCCFVNEYVKSDPRVPFGGVKNSGYGRELSRHGIREFVNRKTIWVQHGFGDDGDGAGTDRGDGS